MTNVEQTNNVPSISRSSMAQSTIVHLELEKAVEQGNTIILSDTKGERLQ